MSTLVIEQNKKAVELNKTITGQHNFIIGTIQKISRKIAEKEREQALRDKAGSGFSEDANFLYTND